MTCYVAARYTDKPRARVVRATLMNRGFQVSSRWLFASNDQPLDVAARHDLEDVRRAHVLIFIQAPPDPRGMRGAYVEAGYALALGRPVFVLNTTGQPLSGRGPDGSANGVVFWNLPQVVIFDTLPALVDALAATAFRLEEGPIG